MSMFDMFGMMGKVKEVQAKMKEFKEYLPQIEAVGESGAGMVKATVNGERKVLKVEMEPALVKPEDREMIQDLVAAAVNHALQQVEIKIKEELKKRTEGILPNIPGLDLSNLGGMM